MSEPESTDPATFIYDDDDTAAPTDAPPDAETTNRWRFWNRPDGDMDEAQAFRVRDRLEVRRQMAREGDPAPVPQMTPDLFTMDDYAQLLHQQGGVCAGCGDPPAGLLRLDHRDDGPGVSGLLCDWCFEVVRTVELERAAKILGYMVRRRANG